MKKIITSEYVSYGHPDKVADQISDAILDAIMEQDPNVRTGIEVMVKDNIVVLGGEINTNADINYESVVRSVFENIVYPEDHNLSPSKIKVINLLGVQSDEIAGAVDKENGCIGAGDQGFMVGYASNDTTEFLPLGVYMARKIGAHVAEMENIGPDVKTQVVVELDTKTQKSVVKTILVSAMHNGLSLEDAKENIEKAICKNEMSLEDGIFKHQIKNNVKLNLSINPAGEWTIGGSVSDCGITGRKIVVDQYGGYCTVGGGAFSGKDMTKVDRSAAYMCRYLAKNLVASGLVNTAKVELGYEIGTCKPTAFNIETSGYEGVIGEGINEAFKNFFNKWVDMTPKGIICRFNGTESKYYNTARNGHFGFKGDEVWYPWEMTDLAEDILKYISEKEIEISE